MLVDVCFSDVAACCVVLPNNKSIHSYNIGNNFSVGFNFIRNWLEDLLVVLFIKLSSYAA